GGADWNDRRPAEPTPETLALMGVRAKESTVGITCFMTEDGTGFSGVLKQRYSDFIVHEVAPGGDVCKGTDFPGLLRPADHVLPPGHPHAHLESHAAETAAAMVKKDEGKDAGGAEEKKGGVVEGDGDGGKKGAVAMEQEEEG
ncbi:unnamed protein product, partial [Scytosiphon promiscuus]